MNDERRAIWCARSCFAFVSLGLVAACGAAPTTDTVITLSPPPSSEAPTVPPAASSAPTSTARETPHSDAIEWTMETPGRSAFATYLVAMHERIHPRFADTFLSSLDALPSSDPANVPDLVARVEIVLDGATGTIERLGLTKNSGSTAFDVGVLVAIQDASPFKPAPKEIRSFDGKVYTAWSFHRDPMVACSLRETTPTILAKP